jgi:hypothetical protein
MSWLNTTVSFYKNVYDVHSTNTINLFGFLDSDEYKDEITEIRSLSEPEEIRRLKLDLPCVTVSGTFRKRCSDGLICHSGLIGIDIDAADNRHIPNFGNLYPDLIKIKNVAYCGRSVYSGYFLVIPIISPENHLGHFLALKKLFKKQFSIVIDRQCANKDRLRTISYDPNRYFNSQAVPFSSILREQIHRPRQTFSIPPETTSQDVQKLLEAVQKIQELKLDITGNGYDWWRIGCAIVSVLGSDGRAIFHTVSQFYNNGRFRYNPKETDKKYDQCLSSDSKCSIRTFLWYFRHAQTEVRKS